MNIHIENIELHRNGVTGTPFNAITFQAAGERMLGIIFEQEHHTAVFRLGKLADGNIDYVDNGCRGDEYDSVLRGAVTLVEEMQGMNFRPAEEVEAALATFQSETGTDDEDLLSDFLTHLMHWAKQNNYDFDSALIRGRDHFIAETEGDLARGIPAGGTPD